MLYWDYEKLFSDEKVFQITRVQPSRYFDKDLYGRSDER